MNLLGLDFETTGLDTANDRVTEIGAMVWNVETRSPLATYGEFLYEESFPPISAEASRITGITDDLIAKYGILPALGFKALAALAAKYKVEYIVAHNGENFDRPLFKAEYARCGDALRMDGFEPETAWITSCPWIDTKSDIPFEFEPPSRKLAHLALDLGFLNPFPHRALFDVATMMKVLSHYDLAQVLEYQKIPWFTVRAVVSFDQKDLAKARRYSWEKIGDETYPKQWVKKVKENQFEKEVEESGKAGFQAIRVK